MRILVLLMVGVSLWGADAIGVRVSSDSAPAGSTTQIKIFATAPGGISSATIVMDLDGGVFGDIVDVGSFAGAGDVRGYANVSGLHVDAHLESPSSSLGQTGLPVLTITLPVFAGAKGGATATVTASVTAKDSKGADYQVDMTAGNFTVRGTLAVNGVTPAAGVVAAGGLIRVTGTGLAAVAGVVIDGLTVTSVKVVNDGAIDVTAGSGGEMTGRRVRVMNASGETAELYPSPAGMDPVADPMLRNLRVILPVAGQMISAIPNLLVGHGGITDALALQNPNPGPVTVELATLGSSGNVAQRTVVLAGGATYFRIINDVLNPGYALGSVMYVVPSAPVRMLEYRYIIPGIQPPYANVTVPGGTINMPPPLQVQARPSFVQWNVAVGSADPPALPVSVSGDLGFQVTVAGGENWLGVTPAAGTAPTTVTLTPHVKGLAPGVYRATVNLATVLPAGILGLRAGSATITVALTVTATPALLSTQFTETSFTNPQPLFVTTNGGPVAFTASITGDPLGAFTVTPAAGTTPAVLTVTRDSTLLLRGNYRPSVVLRGASGAVEVLLPLLSMPTLDPGRIGSNVGQVTFVLEAGKTGTQTIQVQPADGTLQVSVRTQTGGEWLSATSPGGSPDALNVNASAATLGRGTYVGFVKLTRADGQVLELPVTLLVSDPPAATTQLKVPASVSFNAGNGVIIPVDSTDVPVVFRVEGATIRPVSFIAPDGRATTPAQLQVLPVGYRELPVGEYTWNIVLHWAKGDVVIPVTMRVTGAPETELNVFTLGSATGSGAFTLAPGEIATVRGQGLSETTKEWSPTASGMVPTELGGTQVLVKGQPAPLLYVSPGQVNFIVPYEVEEGTTVPIQVSYPNRQSTGFSVRVVAVAPGLFTLDGSAKGQAAVRNEDGSVNGQANPAARGSVISIYGTGEGKTMPDGVTGSVTGTDLKRPVLPVTVTIGGVDAPVWYAGTAAYSVAGLFQVNAQIPESVAAGSRVPVVVNVGGVPSQSGVVIAVK